MNLRNTDERVFVWSGVENGAYVSFFFKRINGQWYLIKQKEFPTLVTMTQTTKSITTALYISRYAQIKK